MLDDGLKTFRKAAIFHINMNINLHSFAEVRTICILSEYGELRAHRQKWRSVLVCSLSLFWSLSCCVCSFESHHRQPHKVDCIAAAATAVVVAATTKTTTTDNGTNNSNSLFDFTPVVWTSWLATFYLYHSLFTCTCKCIDPILSCAHTHSRRMPHAPIISNISFNVEYVHTHVCVSERASECTFACHAWSARLRFEWSSIELKARNVLAVCIHSVCEHIQVKSNRQTYSYEYKLTRLHSFLRILFSVTPIFYITSLHPFGSSVPRTHTDLIHAERKSMHIMSTAWTFSTENSVCRYM